MNLATLSFGDITGFKTVVSVCLEVKGHVISCLCLVLLCTMCCVHHALCPSFSQMIFCPHPSFHTTLYVLPSPSLSTVPIHHCTPLSMSFLLPHYLLSPSIIVHHSLCPSFSLTIYCPHPSLFHHSLCPSFSLTIYCPHPSLFPHSLCPSFSLTIYCPHPSLFPHSLCPFFSLTIYCPHPSLFHHSLCPSFSLTIYCHHPSLFHHSLCPSFSLTIYCPFPSLFHHSLCPSFSLTIYCPHPSLYTTLYVLPSPSLSTAPIHHCTPLSMSFLLPHYLLPPSIIVSPLSMSFLLPHYLLPPSIIVSPPS